MPLRNRVTPRGDIIAVLGRGLMMGNRGVLHNARRQIVRDWAVKRWIACRLEFRGRHRHVMTPNRYTELFFLDEATAFAAGHRPCAECRNADYKKFRRYWERAIGPIVSVNDIDNVLHAERLDRGAKKTWTSDVRDLPNGTFVIIAGTARLVWDDALPEWSDAGYRNPIPRPSTQIVDVLTPPAIVAILRAGYVPAVSTIFPRAGS